MKIRSTLLAFPLALPCLSVPFLLVPGGAQRTPATLIAATAPTTVPSLVPYSATATASDGGPLAGEVGMTFLIYK